MTELEKEVVKHEEQIKTLFENQKKLETVVDKIDSLATSIAKLTLVQQGVVDEQKALRTDVDNMKQQPVKDAHELKMTVIKLVITAVVSAIVGALIALVIK